MVDPDDSVVKLKRPADYEILEDLSDGERNVGVNIAANLDRTRGYINTRLPQLEDYDLLERVGPAENTGLYQITTRGLAALDLREHYESDDYEQLVDDRAEDFEIVGPRIIDHADD